jgi:hypothetical protein
MLANEPKEGISVDSLRRKLISGESVEVAGYELAPELAHAIDNAKFVNSLSNVQSAHWFEVLTQASLQLPPGRSKLLQSIASTTGQPTLHLITGDQFWSSPEPVDCPELITRTLTAMDEI